MPCNDTLPSGDKSAGDYMGLFTKNTMTIRDMTGMVAFTAIMIIVRYHATGVWPPSSFRTAELINRVQEMGHRASAWKQSQLSLLADNIARHIASDPDGMMHIALSPLENDTQEAVMAMAHKALFQAGIVN